MIYQKPKQLFFHIYDEDGYSLARDIDTEKVFYVGTVKGKKKTVFVGYLNNEKGELRT